MKKATVTSTSLALVFGAALLAHGADTKASRQAEPGKYTGCLAAGASEKEFKLTHVNGGKDEYTLVGGKDLKGHIGHKVEIQGKLTPATGEKTEEPKQHLDVASMKHVDATCP